MKGVRRVKLGEVAELVRQVMSPGDMPQGTRYVGLEHILSTGEIQANGPVEPGEIASNKFEFHPGQILFGKLRPYLRKVARPDFRGVCSTDIIPIQPSRQVDAGFLFHMLRTDEFIDRATALATGANLPRISPKLLVEFEFPLPTLEEQRRIAAILDQADTLRRHRRAALERLTNLIEATLTDFLASDISYKWPLVSLGNCGDVQGGLQVSAKRKGDGPPVPYLRVANVYRNRLDLGEIKVMPATLAEVARLRLEAGDILIVEGHGNAAEIGRTALWDGSIPDCIHQNHLIRVRPNRQKLEPTFASLYLNSSAGRLHLVGRGRTTSGLNTISVRDVRETPIPLPPLSLQRAFADRVRAIEVLKARHRAHLSHLDALFASLQHRAINGGF